MSSFQPFQRCSQSSRSKQLDNAVKLFLSFMYFNFWRKRNRWHHVKSSSQFFSEIQLLLLCLLISRVSMLQRNPFQQAAVDFLKSFLTPNASSTSAVGTADLQLFAGGSLIVLLTSWFWIPAAAAAGLKHSNVIIRPPDSKVLSLALTGPKTLNSGVTSHHASITHMTYLAKQNYMKFNFIKKLTSQIKLTFPKTWKYTFFGAILVLPGEGRTSLRVGLSIVMFAKSDILVCRSPRNRVSRHDK